MKKSIVLILTSLVSFLALNAKTLTVPEQYSTIQAALNGCHTGDTILVSDGIYSGSLTWPTFNRVVLKSVNGASTTFLDGNSQGAVLTMTGGASKLLATIDGFTVQNGLTRATAANGFVAGGSGVSIVNGTITISNCSFTSNKIIGDPLNFSYCNGAAINADNSRLNIYNCQFFNNTVDSTGNVYGGVIYASNTQVMLSKASFGNNSILATTSIQGGVLAVTFGVCSIKNVSFTENEISVSGTGSISGGSCYFLGDGSAQFSNALIGDNTLSASNTVQGGGVWSTYSTSMLHCTIAGNHYTTGSGIGGNSVSLNSYNGNSPRLKIMNSILWNPEGSLVEAAFVGVPSISYCDIYSGLSGSGNTASDPIFVSSSDFHLQNSSPCLSKSSPVASTNPPLDLDDNLRPMPSGTLADLGCFETNQPLRIQDAVDAIEPVVEIYPNPVHQSSTISFVLTDDSKVTVTLLDLSGRKIKDMLNETLPSGAHNISLNADNLSAGDYFLQMQIGNKIFSEKITVD